MVRHRGGFQQPGRRQLYIRTYRPYPGTVYYHAYATNGGGTSYGAPGTFTTGNAGFIGQRIDGFGNVCLNNQLDQFITITGTNLTHRQRER